MNFIKQVSDDLFLQCVEQIAHVDRVMLPLAGAAFYHAPIVVGGDAVRDGENYIVENGQTAIFVLCRFTIHNDDDQYYFSPSKNALYKGSYVSSVPEDSIVISESEWAQLVSGINDRAIVMVNGRPVLSDYEFPKTNTAPMYTVAQLLPQIKQYRTNYIAFLDCAVAQYRRQVELEIATTLTRDEYIEVLQFIQKVCDFVRSLDPAMEIRSEHDLNWPVLPENLREKV